MTDTNCPRCGSRLVKRDVSECRCLRCWWSSRDWALGHMRPVTTRIEYGPREEIAVRVVRRD